MFDFIKYPHLEWRKRHEYCVPKGPSFRWAPWVTIPIAGSRLRLKAPRHSPRRSGVEQWRLLPGRDLLDDPRLNHMATGYMANDHWGNAPALSRRFAFWGPWMSGCKAQMTMSVCAWGRQKGHEFADISFFHPKAFEMVLVQYLNDRYGHKHWNVHTHIPRWHGPADWQRHNHLPVFAGSCKIYSQGPDPDITNNLSFPEHLFFFPITDQHFVEITFVQHLYSRDKNGDIAFDTAPIQALQDAIVNSISLELSPAAQASYDRIKKEVRNMQLPKEFAPLKWPIDPAASQPPVSDSANTATGQDRLWKR